MNKMSRRKNLLRLNDSSSLDNSYLPDEPSPLIYPSISKLGRAETKRNSAEDDVSDEEVIEVPRRIAAASKSLDTSENDEKYFNTPKASKRPPANVPDKSTSKQSKNKRPLKTKITRYFNKGIEPKDSREEELQMAIALSKSLSSQDSQDTCPLSLKETLAKFGFGSERPKSSLENKLNNAQKQPRNKNRHIQPLLLLLTDDRRQSLIEEKISSILSNIDHKPTLISPEPTPNVTNVQLSQYVCKDNCIFKLHANGENPTPFYVEALQIKPTLVKCGSLLKKWDSIPGRAVTPPLETTSASCLSPDLFESDDEVESTPVISNSEVISSCSIGMDRPNITQEIDNREQNLTASWNLADSFTRRHEIESDVKDKKDNDFRVLSPIVIESDSDDDLPHDENVLDSSEVRLSTLLKGPAENEDADKERISSSFSESKEAMVIDDFVDNSNVLDQSWSGKSQSLSGSNEMQSSLIVVESDDDPDLICSQECEYTSENELEQYFRSVTPPESSQILDRQPETPPNDYNLHDDTVLLSDGADKVATPHSNLIIKYDNVTPCPDYDRMLTPEVVRELDKFGFKAVKRRKGVKLLKYIYDCTHPLVREVPEQCRVKRMRVDSARDKSLESDVEVVGDLLSESALDDVVLEKKQCKTKLGCRVPLHIAFHNLISSSPQLKENILMYEPIQLEVVHLMLKQHGFTYPMDDLLAFMDKKCITVKYNQVPSTRRK